MSYGGFPYLGYVAGIIDGEGCIRMPREQAVCIVVKMTDLDVLERCQAVTGIGKIYGPYLPSNGNKPQWTWSVAGRDAAALAMTIYPFMCKRRQDRIREALQKWRSKPYVMVRYRGPSDERRCGTYAGYGRHYRVGTPPCQPCADAAVAYTKARRKRGLK